MSAVTTALHREDGMTLVELLLVSVLMLVVLGATLTSFNAFERNTRTNERQNEAQEQARRALDLAARDLRNLASPTRNLPLAVDRHAPQDVIFQAEGSVKPSDSANQQNTTRMRYCYSPERQALYQQVQTWTSALPPGIPAGSGCPAAGWSRTLLVADSVVNGERPLFTYNATQPDEITEVSTQLHVDVNPGRRPGETSLQTSVFLRNQNRAPSASFTWASAPNSSIFLNASASQDPEEKALTYEWWDASLNKKVGEGIVFTYKPPMLGNRTMYLIVRDAMLETKSANETVCASGTGVTCSGP